MSREKSLNSVTLLGVLGKDPEVRSTTSGQKIAGFSLATDEGYYDRSEKWIDATEWHKITAWGKLAEKAEKKLLKGDTVMILGKLKTDSWTDQNGVKKYSTSIIAEQLKLIDDRGRALQIKQNGGQPPSSMPTPSNGMPHAEEDDLPF